MSVESVSVNETTPHCPRCGEPATHATTLIHNGRQRELWCSHAHRWLWNDPALEHMSDGRHPDGDFEPFAGGIGARCTACANWVLGRGADRRCAECVAQGRPVRFGPNAEARDDDA